MLKHIVEFLKKEIAARKGGESLINWYRSKGVKTGKNCYIGPFKSLDMDLPRSYLLEMRDNVRINYGLTIMTHNFAALVFKKTKGEFCLLRFRGEYAELSRYSYRVSIENCRRCGHIRLLVQNA